MHTHGISFNHKGSLQLTRGRRSFKSRHKTQQSEHVQVNVRLCSKNSKLGFQEATRPCSPKFCALSVSLRPQVVSQSTHLTFTGIFPRVSRQRHSGLFASQTSLRTGLLARGCLCRIMKRPDLDTSGAKEPLRMPEHFLVLKQCRPCQECPKRALMSDLHFSLLSTAIMQSPEDEINRSRTWREKTSALGSTVSKTQPNSWYSP